jgi:hypothetical protein
VCRGLAADGRLVRFNCTVTDRPGGIARMTKLLWDKNISVKVRPSFPAAVYCYYCNYCCYIYCCWYFNLNIYSCN